MSALKYQQLGGGIPLGGIESAVAEAVDVNVVTSSQAYTTNSLIIGIGDGDVDIVTGSEVYTTNSIIIDTGNVDGILDNIAILDSLAITQTKAVSTNKGVV